MLWLCYGPLDYLYACLMSLGNRCIGIVKLGFLQHVFYLDSFNNGIV